MPITQFDPKPVTVVNNLTTDDANKALSAAQGKYLYDNRYVHPTTTGNKHIPSGGSANQWLKYSADGTAAWAALPAASTSQAGIVQLSSSLTSSSETVAATSKAVQTLNNNLTTITTLTATYNSSFSWTTSGLGIYAYKYLNKILMVTGFMYCNGTNGIAYDSVLATINDVNIQTSAFHSSNGSAGTNCRLALKNNGSNVVLRNESVIPVGEWFSFTFTVLLK